MKYYIKTFGCQMNVSDSERIETFLESKNFTVAEKISDADLVIFNTCGIKQTAENRAYSIINNLCKSRLKAKSYKLKAIIMTGCLANRPDVQKRMKNKVDLFCEIKNFRNDFEKLLLCRPELVSEPALNLVQGSRKSTLALQSKKMLKQIQHDTLLKSDERDYLSIAPKYANKFQAYVPIMTGCNNFCSYCVVPYARGREVSRPAEEIITEVKDLVKKGYKSITLLGQNVNSYKSKTYQTKKFIKPKDDMDFPTLLKKLDKIPGKFWISFVSSHPKDMSDELIETATKCKKVCEWIHLPVQAGDDKILQKMNRHYTQKDYLKLIQKIKTNFKKHKPDVLFSITSDIIVGFPSETKTQFLQSASIMKKAKYDLVFFGQFSPRPGTLAWKMKDNVSQKEKVRRENFLNDILAQTTFTNNKKYIGKTLEVLIEKEKDNFYFGKTRTQKNVKFISCKKNLVGTFAKVEIIKANIWNLEGKIK